MSLSDHLQGFVNKGDNTSLQVVTSLNHGTDNVKKFGEDVPKAKPKPEQSDTINSILVKATFGISERSWVNALNRLRDQPSARPVVLVDRIVLVSICMVVAMGFCVPIIIYAVDADRSGADNSTITLDFDVDQCSSASVTLNTTSQVCLLPGLTTLASYCYVIAIANLRTCMAARDPYSQLFDKYHT